jgi:hypothetical protein
VRSARRWSTEDLQAHNDFHRGIQEDEMRRAARVDSNQQELVQAMRKIGAKVYHVRKPLDLLVGYRGRNILVEVKRPEKKGHADEFTKEEKEFIEGWPGEIAICYTVEEAINAVVNGGVAFVARSVEDAEEALR